jgi:hypothetical protein
MRQTHQSQTREGRPFLHPLHMQVMQEAVWAGGLPTLQIRGTNFNNKNSQVSTRPPSNYDKARWVHSHRGPQRITKKRVF